MVAHDGEFAYLVEQPREVVGEERLLELPAGKIDPGEEPEETAARELIEEIGKRAGRLEPLGTVYASPGFSNETFHLFLATELSDESADAGEEERITVRAVPLSDLDEVIAGARDAKTLIGLLLLRGRLPG
jgi:ADP-ribose pyrophosphatase